MVLFFFQLCSAGYSSAGYSSVGYSSAGYSSAGYTVLQMKRSTSAIIMENTDDSHYKTWGNHHEPPLIDTLSCQEEK